MGKLEKLKAKVASLGLKWPPPPRPVAKYVTARHLSGLVSVSGMVPIVDGKPLYTGKVGREVTLEQAQECARQCVLNALAALEEILQQDFEGLIGAIKLRCYVSATEDFTDHSKVADGASELLAALLGSSGLHARVAVGCNSLPLNVPVEVEFEFQVQV